MRKQLSTLLVLLSLMCSLLASDAAAAFWSSAPLLTLNGQEYNDEDFRNWWKHWNDRSEMPVPETMDDYIDFQLLAQEALAMEYDQQPAYLEKLRVFLKVNSLMFLKNEEVGRKINLSDEDIRQYFNERYAPLWDLQILTFKDKPQAEASYLKMKAFDGQKAGQLVFADMQGSGELRYEQVKISPEDFRRNNKEEWLQIVRELEEDHTSEPVLLEDGGNYVLFRLNNISQPDESVYEAKKERSKHDLYKMLENKFTGELVEGLKKKYSYFIDEELIGQIDLETEYPIEFLDRTVIRIADQEFTARDFIHNIVLDMRKRPGVGLDFVKGNVAGNITYQVLVDLEALDRHYERQEFFIRTWEFYQQNRLRLALEEGLLARQPQISDEEALQYYNDNKEEFEAPATETYIKIGGEQDLVDKVWVGLLHGRDIFEIADEYGLAAMKESLKQSDLTPELEAITSNLAEGEFSKPFSSGDKYEIIKLLSRTAYQKHTYAQVSAGIKEKLFREKAAEAKKTYMKQVRNRSSITVNENKWNKLKEELR